MKTFKLSFSSAFADYEQCRLCTRRKHRKRISPGTMVNYGPPKKVRYLKHENGTPFFG